ncbi:hypothetical protein D3C81_1635730 [compost metagenome]
MLDFAAIGVIDAIAEVDAGSLRLFDYQHLIGTHAKAAVGQVLPLRRSEIDGLVDGVDDNEIVARTMHFCEFEFHIAIIAVAGKRVLPAGRKCDDAQLAYQ